MKHLNRFGNGILAIFFMSGFVVLMSAIFHGIDAFVAWRYRNGALVVVGVLILVYLIGCFIELLGWDK